MTGGLDRTTGYEPGIVVRDWGLVVGTGCGHAVVSTCRHAMRLTGVDRLYAVVGGFHLSGPLLEPLIEMACADLQRTW